jgi:hypothetical protein
MNKAFRILLPGFPTGITAAETRSKAQYKAFKSLRDEAGYVGYKFTDLRVTRAPEFDAWAKQDTSGWVMTEDILRKRELAVRLRAGEYLQSGKPVVLRDDGLVYNIR